MRLTLLVMLVLAGAALVGCGPVLEPEMIIDLPSDRPVSLPPGDFRVVDDPVAIAETDVGQIVVKLYPEKAPYAVKAFAWLASQGFYDNVIFYRVVKDRLVQTGDPLGTGYGGPNWPAELELSDLRQDTGSVVMARSADPALFRGHFYICLDALPEREGQHTVFGKVIKGLDVANAISQVETDSHYGRPLNPVMLRSVRVVSRTEAGS